MKTMTLTAQKALRLDTPLPGDKSVSHRAAILASLARGRSEIRNFLESGDCLNTLKIFRKLGIRASRIRPGVYRIHGAGLHGLRPPRGKLDCGNSGTTLRLLAGLLAAQPFDCVLAGDASLQKRPMDRIVAPLKTMGANIRGRGKKQNPPLKIRGRQLRPITYRLPVASAQVKSAVLLAGLFCEGETVVIEPIPTRDHTERFFRFTGLPLSRRGDRMRLRGGVHPRPFDMTIPGDISSAAFLVGMGLLVPGSRITLRGALLNRGRDGFLRVLRRMKANLKVYPAGASGPEKTADITVRPAKALRATVVQESEVPSLIDELPILMTLATQAKGKSWFRGVQELRVKETDRIHSMVSQLGAMGARIGVLGNDVWVEGPSPLCAAAVKSFGDHRTAMCLITAGMIASGKTMVRDVGAIATSFPAYFRTLRRAGCRFRLK